MATQFKLRRDTAANWTSANPTLAAGEPGVETDTGKLKIGNGTSAWTSLAYFAATFDASAIASGTLAAARIADSSITSAKIADGTIVTADIADSSITSAKIVDGTIATADIADGAITTAKIAALAVVTADIADGAVTDAKVASGISASKLTAGTLPLAQLPSITTAYIADGAVTDAKITGVSAAKVSGTVANASYAASAGSASSATSATSATNATNATTATQLSNSGITFGNGGSAWYSNAPIAITTGHLSAQSGIYCAATYNQTNTGRAVYIASDGLFGVGSSSQRFKENIADAALSVDALRSIAVRTFNYKKDFGADQSPQIGVIAEELVDLGLSEFVFFDEDGIPDGVAYEKLALAALALVQAQADRLDAIETRLAALEK